MMTGCASLCDVLPSFFFVFIGAVELVRVFFFRIPTPPNRKPRLARFDLHLARSFSVTTIILDRSKNNHLLGVLWLLFGPLVLPDFTGFSLISFYLTGSLVLPGLTCFLLDLSQ